MIWVVLIVFICALDQITKYLVIHNIAEGSSHTVVQGFFYLSHIKNRGIAMGMLQDGRIVVIPITILIAITVGVYLFKTKNSFLKLTLAMILGGAVGNLIDRIFMGGGVTDFFEFRFGTYTFYIFNVADVFVVVGTFFLAFYLLFIHKEKEKSTV